MIKYFTHNISVTLFYRDNSPDSFCLFSPFPSFQLDRVMKSCTTVLASVYCRVSYCPRSGRYHFHMCVCLRVCLLLPSRHHWSHDLRVCLQGVCIGGLPTGGLNPGGRPPHPNHILYIGYGQRTGVMHPTGMLSCYVGK